VYPPGLPNGVEVRGSDLARLDDDEFLNDTVIDLYIRCIIELFLLLAEKCHVDGTLERCATWWPGPCLPVFQDINDCRLLDRFIQEHLPEEIRKQCHFFNSFFFKKLTEKGGRKSGDSNASGGASDGKDSAYKRGFERVRKWTRVSRQCSVV
jgi:Ulp1 family protease